MDIQLHSGEVLMGITWWLVSMSMTAVALRFYCRCIGQAKVGLDDWTMLMAVALMLAAQILMTIIYSYGLGQTDDLTLDQMKHIFRLEWIFVPPICLSSVFARIAIAILLSRIFKVKKWFRWYLTITTFIAACLVIVLIVELWTSCTPQAALWDPVIAQTAKCLDPNVFLGIEYAYQGVLTLTDITFVVFPVSFVWKLNMPLKKRIGLAAIFGLGLLTAAASCVKIYCAQSTSKQHGQISSTIPTLIWGTIEASLVVIMGCIPTFGPLTRITLPKIRDYVSRSLPTSRSAGSSEATKISTKANVESRGSSQTDASQHYELKSGVRSSGGPMSLRNDSQASTV